MQIFGKFAVLVLRAVRLPTNCISYFSTLVLIDLMDDDVTRPKSSMAVVITLKSKMAACSATGGGIGKST